MSDLLTCPISNLFTVYCVPKMSCCCPRLPWSVRVHFMLHCWEEYGNEQQFRCMAMEILLLKILTVVRAFQTLMLFQHGWCCCTDREVRVRVALLCTNERCFVY